MEYFYCEVCGNKCECTEGLGDSMTCCGQKMNKVECNSDDHANKEKHVPVYMVEDNKVCIKVGEELHPSTPLHFIEWVKLITDKGEYTRYLTPDDKPEVCFTLDKHEKVEKVLTYCNIHGLWKSRC